MKTAASKPVTIIFWVSTVLLAAMMTMSAIAYLTTDAMQQAFTHLGFPGYFRVELAIAKILGAIALLAPVPSWIKEWAYAGFFLTCLSAVIAHGAVDGLHTAVPPLIGLAITLTSYLTYRRRLAA